MLEFVYWRYSQTEYFYSLECIIFHENFMYLYAFNGIHVLTSRHGKGI
jgi:hypothetical protein